ncbi:HNH endonuclease [Natronosalvus caseinilyticus]|uniref:HNH endonuclease n=1 Tax=Natronosalvus caseinilyticus TaxID=2953747 RepID=UPI0028AC975B|nr:HNH endonuclease [Natronosalvus caseinilyticus]
MTTNTIETGQIWARDDNYVRIIDRRTEGGIPLYLCPVSLVVDPETDDPNNWHPDIKKTMAYPLRGYEEAGPLISVNTLLSEWELVRWVDKACNECGKTVWIRSTDFWVCRHCGHSKNLQSKVRNISEVPKESNAHDEADAVADFEDDSPDLATLRKRAGECASEAVDPVSATTQTYEGSDVVKTYVKARAEGKCEGCGEPAFQNKSGDPYFHAHHINELSDGGPDRPDMVIALCPNCHCRVHHGEDGENYNEKLREWLADIESDEYREETSETSG